MNTHFGYLRRQYKILDVFCERFYKCQEGMTMLSGVYVHNEI